LLRSYLRGLDTVQNYKKAKELFEFSAFQQGDDGAYIQLGIIFQQGYGVDQDFEKAIDYYKHAIDEAEAKCHLGIMYQNGYGVEQDYTKAIKFYKKAADGGCAYAKYFLGDMHERGLGVDQDSIQAKYWHDQCGNIEELFANDWEHEFMSLNGYKKPANDKDV